MANATPASPRSPGAMVDTVVALLRAEDTLSPQTVDRLGSLMRQFAGFIERGHGADALEDVSPAMVESYLNAPTSDGLGPGVSLQQFRRLAVRVLFRRCRRLGMDVGDPSVDAALGPRCAGAFRPLEDDEVELARAAALGSDRRVRAAAAWTLCEATARTGELAAVCVRDLDLDNGRAWISGTPRTAPRWGELTDWGVAQLGRRILELGADLEARVVGGGTPGSALAQSSAVGAISRTLTRAGLGEAPGVRPSSVAAWAGRKIFEETGRIDIVTRRLGVASLDRAARFIGWDWRSGD